MTTLLLVGCGKMGGALLRGWSQSENLVISTLDPHNEHADYSSASEIPSPHGNKNKSSPLAGEDLGEGGFDIIILAVKPQVMTEVAQSLTHLITPRTLIISIAAGKTLAFFENLCGAAQPIIRAMPNTPAIIGKGMTVLCGNAACTEQQKQQAMNLMAAVGDAEWIDDENLMDAVTALSGSGPAYVFHMIEAMTAAGVAAGLSPALAAKLARGTLIGAAALADSDMTTPAATLRQNVTSPGGTTEAALKILMADNGLSALMTRAILAAKSRSEDLAT